MSTNFTTTDNRFKCSHCGHLPENGMNQRLITGLNKLQNTLKTDLKINSGYRCPTYNNSIEDASKTSQHVSGEAVDINVPEGLTYSDLFLAIINISDFDGQIIKYDKVDGTFIHVSVSNEKITKKILDKQPDGSYNDITSNPKEATQIFTEIPAESSSSFDPSYILKFTQMVTSWKFKDTWSTLFSQAGMTNIWNLITNFLSSFFYNVYTIPNLPKCKAIVIKPETLFGFIPSCNVILPIMKNMISYSRNYKAEPTRMMIKTAPYQFEDTSSNHALGTIVGLNINDNNQEIISAFTPPYNTNNISYTPLFQATDYEKKYGVRVDYAPFGDDVFTFMSTIEGTKGKPSVINKNTSESMSILNRLASYALTKARYSQRQGTMSLYFNPFIAPGFPFVSLENKELTPNALSIYGYVTDVTHNITDRSWATQVGFTAAHPSSDVAPLTYPLIEDAFDPTKGAEGATQTFKDIFGDEVYAIDPKQAQTQFMKELSRDEDATDAYTKVARQGTTLEEYMSEIAQNCTLNDAGNYIYLTGSYFNSDTQKILLEYTELTMKERQAFSINETR